MTELAARDVVWSAGGRPILKGITLEVRSGEVLGLLGPNGAGKTSLLRVLAGLRRPASGDVRLGGADVARMRRRALARRLAIVEQSPEVHEDVTVQETVALGRTPHRRRFANLARDDHRAIDRALVLTGLSTYRTRTWRSLSGGEQQRAQLARALAQEPEVILLDEPTNHLDIRYQLEVLSLLSSLDMTVVTALHDLNLAARYCDSVTVLQDGVTRASGAPREVLTVEMLRRVYEVDAVVETSVHTGAPVATYLGGAKESRLR
ncbi:ABC transporter ATP-binding protein [Microbacterium sp. RD1]|uniref:ABC transporter ATP-binding protein n=1 Tax=Microbacterium sp. RD1 TaxID=3457313 RepID=UPI003FA5F40F